MEKCSDSISTNLGPILNNKKGAWAPFALAVVATPAAIEPRTKLRRPKSTFIAILVLRTYRREALSINVCVWVPFLARLIARGRGGHFFDHELYAPRVSGLRCRRRCSSMSSTSRSSNVVSSALALPWVRSSSSILAGIAWVSRCSVRLMKKNDERGRQRRYSCPAESVRRKDQPRDRINSDHRKRTWMGCKFAHTGKGMAKSMEHAKQWLRDAQSSDVSLPAPAWHCLFAFAKTWLRKIHTDQSPFSEAGQRTRECAAPSRRRRSESAENLY